MTHSESIDHEYLERLRSLDLPVRKQRSPYVVLHMTGDGIRTSKKFNFQVYIGRGGKLTLVTNDKFTLDRLLSGEGEVDEGGKRIILMDDSGWGFPIGGVLCGAYDFETGRFYVREVEVKHFQGFNFKDKTYLNRFRDRALEIVDEINPNLEETVIKICTGYVNIRAKDSLREKVSLVVEVDEIGEPLQTWLEQENKTYIRGLVGNDLYYDPKKLSRSETARRFYDVVDFAEKKGLMHLVKTGWSYFQHKYLGS